MTIIVAGTYSQGEGILVAYDTVNHEIRNSCYIPDNDSVHKFRWMNGYGVGMALSGKGFLNLDFANFKHNLRTQTNKQIAIQRQLLSLVPNDPREAMMMSVKGFIIDQDDLSSLLVVDPTSPPHYVKPSTHTGMGAIYSGVQDHFTSQYSPQLSEGDLTSLILDTFELADKVHKRSIHFRKGAILRGFGLVRITKDGFTQLEFE